MPSRFSARAPALAALFLLLGSWCMAACRRPDGATSPASAPGTASGHASGQAAGAPAVPGPPAPAAPAAPTSELHVDRSKVFYDVTGGSARALLEELMAKGPRVGPQHHFGRTSWTARWEISYEQPGGAGERSCRMRRADVYMEVKVTLPHWDRHGTAPAALTRDWKRFTDALAFHEREHRESILSAGRRVVRVLKTLQAPSCRALKKKANARARALIEQARDYNRRYDERTDHGRTQGAHWPLR